MHMRVIVLSNYLYVLHVFKFDDSDLIDKQIMVIYHRYDLVKRFTGGIMMRRLFVLGSINMDLSIETDVFPIAGETLHGSDFLMNAGGKGGNQAVAAAKAGSDIYMIGCVGEDAYGDMLLESLMKLGIHTQYVDRTKDVSTGIAMVWRCQQDNRILLHEGANHAVSISQVKQCLDDKAQKGDIFLTQLECPYKLVKEALEYASQLGLYNILNPAPAQELDEDVYRAVNMIIVNESECHCLTGIEPNDQIRCQTALHQFKKRGCDAIITLGKKGSVTLHSGAVYGINAFPVHTIDTTAAGDTFIGALCHCLLEDMKLQDALMYASAASAITVTRAGAQNSIPYDEQTKAFLGEYT